MSTFDVKLHLYNITYLMKTCMSAQP